MKPLPQCRVFPLAEVEAAKTSCSGALELPSGPKPVQEELYILYLSNILLSARPRQPASSSYEQAFDDLGRLGLHTPA